MLSGADGDCCESSEEREVSVDWAMRVISVRTSCTSAEVQRGVSLQNWERKHKAAVSHTGLNREFI